MPNQVEKVSGGYANINQITGKSHGTTTKKKANAQKVILDDAEHFEKTGKHFLPALRKGVAKHFEKRSK